MQKVIDLSIGYKKMGCVYFCKKYGKSSFWRDDCNTAFFWNALIIAHLWDYHIPNKQFMRLENRFCVIS